ncbi:putative TRX2-thioredoxin II [Meira miltonrushii]|uniref:Thioredoxin n=1 Tax=Meira miltonrushii TaxID=1280837 RepID=A0A316V6R9_9BASI|nr:putative TRX2-thioredoxin II [Meira miltonrushii]PWN33299.1 putative TRX2-thioredoxin II [Meira miltonrushii]
MSVQAIESYEDFQKIINGDKIAAIDFWATWCGPCKMISPLFEKFAGEAPSDQIAFYKVDVDEQEKISQEVGITAMPTFVFFKNGQKITQTVGANPQQLQAAIKQVVSA